MSFYITLTYVAVMLAYAIPGFLLIKFKAIEPDKIASFSKLLLFVAQPCQVVAAFQKLEYSPVVLKNMGLAFLISFTLQIILLGVLWLVLRGNLEKISNRVFVCASFMTNCTFMGVPLLESLMPGYAEGPVYAMMFSMSMNILAWTVCAYVITKDKKFISVKKIIINPAVLPLFVAVPMFMADFILPKQIGEMIELLSKMTTPLCMIILGMRLATVKFKDTFLVAGHYILAIINQVVMPLMAYLLCTVIGLDADMRKALVIICCCPIAAIALNLTEILKTGQKTAGSLVLVGTLLSIITIPLVTLIL